MTFARKIFAAIFLSTLLVGTALIWCAHSYVEKRVESDFVDRYSVLTGILGDSLTRLETNTEDSMLNAALMIADKDHEKGLQSSDELRALRNRTGVTHVFVTDKNGRFIRSTNEDVTKIPNLFSFSPIYKKMLDGESAFEATPLIIPRPEQRPFKFLSVPNFDRSRIIEVGVRVDFISATLDEAIRADKNISAMTLYAPDGTQFGSFTKTGLNFSSQKTKLPLSLDVPADEELNMKFYTRVTSTHSQCSQCDIAETSVAGKYYYVLENKVSKSELIGIQTKTSQVAIVMLMLNALLSALLARLLSTHLVRNIENAVTRIQDINRSGLKSARINLASNDEIAFLTGEFDRLLDTLEDSQRKLVEAEKIESKVELARVVAHNIRSPIVAIEMMIPGMVGVPDRMKRILKLAVSEIKQLSEQLRLQSSSSIIEEKVEIETDLVFLPVFIEDLVGQKRLEHIALKNAEFVLNFPLQRERMFVKVGSTELRGVLSNLINNAVESYGGGGGRVTIDLSVLRGSCSIAVVDQGSGIEESDLPKLGTERFSTKDGADRGLGLSHAIDCVKKWSGEINIVSKVNVGTSVFMTIPNYSAAAISVAIERTRARLSKPLTDVGQIFRG